MKLLDLICKPTLAIARSETGVEISWPTNFPNCILETAFDLSGVWNTATNAAGVSNSNYVVTVNSTKGSAPAPGAPDRALAVGMAAHASGATNAESPQPPAPPKGCREGAATDTRGACAPQTIAKIDAVAAA